MAKVSGLGELAGVQLFEGYRLERSRQNRVPPASGSPPGFIVSLVLRLGVSSQEKLAAGRPRRTRRHNL